MSERCVRSSKGGPFPVWNGDVATTSQRGYAVKEIHGVPQYALTVTNPPVIPIIPVPNQCLFSDPDFLPSAPLGANYFYQFQTPSIDGTYFLAGGALPPGLSLSGSGAITGIPTQLGMFSFFVQTEKTDNTEVPVTEFFSPQPLNVSRDSGNTVLTWDVPSFQEPVVPPVMGTTLCSKQFFLGVPALCFDNVHLQPGPNLAILNQGVDPVVCLEPFEPAKCANILLTVAPVYDGSGKVIGADLTYNQPFDLGEEIAFITLERSDALQAGEFPPGSPDITLDTVPAVNPNTGTFTVRDNTPPNPIWYYRLTLINVAFDKVYYNIVSIAQGANYLSTSGDDATARRGDIDHPALTLAKAVSLSLPGDTIFGLAGTYTEDQMASAPNIPPGVALTGNNPQFIGGAGSALNIIGDCSVSNISLSGLHGNNPLNFTFFNQSILVKITNVSILGNQDNIVAGGPYGCNSIVIDSCNGLSYYDCFNLIIPDTSWEVKNSTFQSVHVNGESNIQCVMRVAKGVISVHDCTFSATDGFSQTSCFTVTGGDVTVTNCTLTASSPNGGQVAKLIIYGGNVTFIGCNITMAEVIQVGGTVNIIP